MNILIVDDEFYIVQGILNNTNWRSIGINQVYCAYSMNQAIKLFEENDIHLLLTDIEMPQNSGLELIEWVNSKGYTPIKLLLTGHENFSYAQKAIQLGCHQYVVKPVQPKKLELILKEAVTTYQEFEATRIAVIQAASWNESSQTKYHRFISELLEEEKEINALKMSNAIERYGLPIQWRDQSFGLLFIHAVINPEYTECAIPLTDLLLSYSDIHSNISYQVDLQNILILSTSSLQCPAEKLLQRLIRDVPSMQFTLFTVEQIYLFHFRKYILLIQEIITNTFSTGHIIMPITAHFALESLPTFSIEHLQFEKWDEYILSNRIHLIINEIEQLLSKTSTIYAIKNLHILHQRLMYAVSKSLETANLKFEDFTYHSKHIDEAVLITQSADSFLYYTKNMLTQLNVFIQSQMAFNPFLKLVKEHVQKNLSSLTLSRNSIADTVHMNPDYISFLFHKQTGENLSTYITNERIQTAKKLLWLSTLSLQEIAEKVGFANASYFHRQFKKVVGMTPQQYRSTSSK